MRCPHCRGEIPPESQFCGVCGQNIHIAQIGTPPQGGPALSGGHNSSGRGGDSALSPSLFDLPVSKGARAVRVGMIVGLNLLMLGGAVALFMGYLNKRDREAAGTSSSVVEPNAKASETATGEVTPIVSDGGSVAVPSTGGGSGKQSGGVNPVNPGGNSATSVPKSDAGARAPGNSAGSGASDSGSSGTGSSGSGSSGSGTPTRSSDAGAPRPTPEVPSSRTPDAGAGAVVSPVLTEEEQARQVQILAGKIGLVVEQHQSQLGRCYENALKQGNPKDPLEGRINLHFSVQPDGSAKGIRVRSNNTGSPTLANCLVGLVGSWTFPSSGSEALDFVWPFEFQSPK